MSYGNRKHPSRLTPDPVVETEHWLLTTGIALLLCFVGLALVWLVIA